MIETHNVIEKVYQGSRHYFSRQLFDTQTQHKYFITCYILHSKEFRVALTYLGKYSRSRAKSGAAGDHRQRTSQIPRQQST